MSDEKNICSACGQPKTSEKYTTKGRLGSKVAREAFRYVCRNPGCRKNRPGPKRNAGS